MAPGRAHSLSIVDSGGQPRRRYRPAVCVRVACTSRRPSSMDPRIADPVAASKCYAACRA